MGSLEEYLEKFSTSQLKALLKEECAGRGDLPLETILLICRLLSERESGLPDPRQYILQLCSAYLET